MAKNTKATKATDRTATIEGLRARACILITAHDALEELGLAMAADGVHSEVVEAALEYVRAVAADREK